MQFQFVYHTAVCFLFFIKLRWSNNKIIDLKLSVQFAFLLIAFKSTAISHPGVSGPNALRRVDLIRTENAREPAQIPLPGTVGRSARVGLLKGVTA